MPDRDPSDRAGEKWHYVDNPHEPGAKVRLRFKMTEDQRQPCVGINTENMMAGDDCETLFDLMACVHKGMDAQYEYIKNDLIPHVCTHLKINPAFRSNAGRIISVAMDHVETLNTPQPKAVLDKLMPTRFFGENHSSRLQHVLAFTCMKSQFHANLHRTVGTANAAAVGQPECISGHCYGYGELVHKTDPAAPCMVGSAAPICATPMIQKAGSIQEPKPQKVFGFIAEGTNWVCQQLPTDERVHLSDEERAMYNETSTFLMELTKSKAHHLRADLGKGMVRMAEVQTPDPKHDIFRYAFDTPLTCL